MDTAAEQLQRFYVEAMYMPGVMTFVVVVVLMVLRKRRPDVSRALLWAMLAACFFGITCAPHLSQILFPEPCVMRFKTPTDLCIFTPAVRLEVGVFAGSIGALLAFFATKVGFSVLQKFR